MSHALSLATTPLLPSFRRQRLILDFASLKHHCPDGIYLTPNQNDPACWTGVYFVREGPYSSAILRFEILFPPSYPEAPPLVIFSTEIFHPLLVPLTTYTFSPGAVDPLATYSASETERLPPGALSLRYGFPHWFTAAERGRASVRNSEDENGVALTKDADSATGSPIIGSKNEGKAYNNISITINLLKYIKSAFEDLQALDELPLDAAGNPNAWHAWRSHRNLPKKSARAESPPGVRSTQTGASLRNPADWNWDGVWEARVRDGVEESAGDALLFGSRNTRSVSTSADPIRFAKFDDEKLASIQDDMLRMHGFSHDVLKE